MKKPSALPAASPPDPPGAPPRRAGRSGEPDPAGPKLGSRVEPEEYEAFQLLRPAVPSTDGKPATQSAVLRAIVLPVLARARQILDRPMPPGATLRDRIEAVLDKGLA
jgi:hypothetical protein